MIKMITIKMCVLLTRKDFWQKVFVYSLVFLFLFCLVLNLINLIYKGIPLLCYGIIGGAGSILLVYYRDKGKIFIDNFNFGAFLIIFVLFFNTISLASIFHCILSRFNIFNEFFHVVVAIFLNIIFLFYLLKVNYLSNYRSIIKIIFYIIFIILFLPFYLNIFYIPYHINGFLNYDGNNDIQNIAQNLTKNLSNPEDKTKALLNWQLNNLTNVYNSYFMRKKPFVVINRRSNNYNLTMYYKHGVCGDFGLLLSKLATASEIENRRVFSPGENHVWVEVDIGDKNHLWANADASWGWFNHQYVYNDFNAYGNQSRVYYIDKDNNQIDITEKYSKVGNLSIYIKSNNENVTSYKIFIRSSKGNLIFPNTANHPNSEGYFNYTLGTKKYTVIAKKNYYWGLITKKAVNNSVTLNENRTTYVVLEPQKYYFHSLLYHSFTIGQPRKNPKTLYLKNNKTGKDDPFIFPHSFFVCLGGQQP